ncbi:MAG TPA: DNA primase, partial [Thermoanaerobaculia bacterium]|nr:DNA primase [Thermoanaerobaculia bacterium]
MSEPVYDITDDVKRDVLAATDLVQLIGTTTSLKKAGRSWKGLCPFHGEKTPSFHVHPDRGFYYCFGCGAKGDAITFVRETERLEFPEAVAYLARLAGITLPMRRSGTRVDRGKETRAAEALALAAAFFRANLDRHGAARALLEKRGLSLEDARAYGLGAALDAWDALKTSLAPRVQEDTALDAGLLQKNPETGRVYDRFRNRLTIEIRDGRGEILGFGARAFGDDQPKYLNSPETARFSKGKLLYGLDRAKEAIRREDAVLLVEGYFDRIACERAGAANAVASMGTALTPAQADLLARQAATVIVAYDGDAPGLAAAYKAFPLLLSRGVNVRHLALPEGHDPDSYLSARGAEALKAAIAECPSLLETLLERIPAAGASDPTERAAKLRE